jgi:hypothetical protein
MRATRAVVTLTSAVIAVCACAFSFGNIWHLALAWGVPGAIAPLVAPMLDVSVVGLMIAVRELSLHAIPGQALLRLGLVPADWPAEGHSAMQVRVRHRKTGSVSPSRDMYSPLCRKCS